MRNELIYSEKECISANKYLYNGKELQDESLGGVNLDWYDFKWRYYDPQIGRFFTQDRLAEKFAYMSPYQFCSNNPISKIELDGLEGIWFQKKLENSTGWQQIQNVAFNTTSHSKFESLVKSQAKFDVYYYSVGKEAWGYGYERAVKSAEEYRSLKYENDNGRIIPNQSGTGFLFKDFNDKEIEQMFSGGKGVVFIGINENQLDYENATELSNAAATVLHEEGSHAVNDINGKTTTTAEDHKSYYNSNVGNWSPDDDEVRNDPKYAGSKAKQDITETDRNAKKEYIP